MLLPLRPIFLLAVSLHENLKLDSEDDSNLGVSVICEGDHLMCLLRVIRRRGLGATNLGGICRPPQSTMHNKTTTTC